MLPMPNLSTESEKWSVFFQMSRMLCQIGNDYKTGQKQGFGDVRSDQAVSRESWAGKGLGIRSPEIDETPLSKSEVMFALKKGLICHG
jgi:hypothetical protein